MELIVLLMALVLFDLAALRWGRDSRDTARGILGAGGIVPNSSQRGI